MKHILISLSFFSFVAHAAPLAFQPYVDAKYECLFIEGANTQIAFASGTSLAQAVATASAAVGQGLDITCNQDHYECIHKDGDVRPGIVYRQSVDKNLKVTGGRIMNLSTGKEEARIGEHYFHQNLRRLPRCKY